MCVCVCVSHTHTRNEPAKWCFKGLNLSSLAARINIQATGSMTHECTGGRPRRKSRDRLVGVVGLMRVEFRAPSEVKHEFE